MDKPHYGQYLKLDTLLNLQHPLSEKGGKVEHDEMLFIIVHQAHELWFKQILFELDAILSIFQQAPISDHKLLTLLRRLQRIMVIQDLLLEQLNVLDTMSPMGFLSFRDKLAPASGLQSVQFKRIEAALGIRLKQPSKGILSDEEYKSLVAQWEKPSLFTCLEAYLERMPYAKSDEYNFWSEYQQAVKSRWDNELNKIKKLDYVDDNERLRMLKQIEKNYQSFNQLFVKSNPSLSEFDLSLKAIQSALFIFLFRNQPVLQIPYQMLTALVKIDENLASWRTKHLLMVQRMIGAQMGSGGTTGAGFLEENLKRRAFGSLTKLSSYMLPEALIPRLPETLVSQMGYKS